MSGVSAPSEEDARPNSRKEGAGEGGLPDPVARETGVFRIDPDLAPGLYVVATPIGNLRDMSFRALDILASVDVVCAEDTRVTGKLLAAFGASARLRPYHDHNAAQARPGLLRELKGGARIALVSDAGTPLVSDPGYKLVREAIAEGVNVIAVPGPSAPLAALTVSGLPSDRFLFAGFPPPKSSARRTFLKEFRTTPATLIFFEGPSRLAESLADMAAVFGDRDAAVARELTKLFEETRRGSLSELARGYETEGPPRGELVIVIAPPAASNLSRPEDLDAAIAAADPDRPLKDIAAEIAAALGLKRRDVYERALELRSEADVDEP